jgi:hypothetical protein
MFEVESAIEGEHGMKIIEVNSDEQSLMMDIDMFIGEHWQQFQGWLESNEMVQPSEEEMEKLMEKFR